MRLDGNQVQLGWKDDDADHEWGGYQVPDNDQGIGAQWGLLTLIKAVTTFFQGDWCIWGEADVHPCWLSKQQGWERECEMYVVLYTPGPSNRSQLHSRLPVCGVRKHRWTFAPLENWRWQECRSSDGRTSGIGGLLRTREVKLRFIITVGCAELFNID